MPAEHGSRAAASDDECWVLEWAGGRAEVQSLGGMLGPLSLHLPGREPLNVLHVAPWSGTQAAQHLPGMLRRLRGEWPCVPFGRTDAPKDLPPEWTARPADDTWSHGYAAHHHWRCDSADASHVALSIEYPDASPVARLQRRISVVSDAAAVTVQLTIHVRQDTRLPLGLHPTFAIPSAGGRVQVLLGEHAGIFSYPSRSAGAHSLAKPASRSEALSAVEGDGGRLHDLSQLPLSKPAEVLLQVKDLRAPAATPRAAPLRLRHLDQGAEIGLWWDVALLPDLLLWISNRGRPEYPWQGRHVALGAEPVNSLFDLGRVASAPEHHPLAHRRGIHLKAGCPLQLHYRIAASELD